MGSSRSSPNHPTRSATRRRRGAAGGRPPAFDPVGSGGRNVVERAFAHLEQCRGLATRYFKRAVVYRGAAVIRAVLLCLNAQETRPGSPGRSMVSARQRSHLLADVVPDLSRRAPCPSRLPFASFLGPWSSAMKPGRHPRCAVIWAPRRCGWSRSWRPDCRSRSERRKLRGRTPCLQCSPVGSVPTSGR
ncbi:transposase [Cellulomonas hominis]|nr:transposase [Cellulomonas hominis]